MFICTSGQNWRVGRGRASDKFGFFPWAEESIVAHLHSQADESAFIIFNLLHTLESLWLWRNVCAISIFWFNLLIVHVQIFPPVMWKLCSVGSSNSEMNFARHFQFTIPGLDCDVVFVICYEICNFTWFHLFYCSVHLYLNCEDILKYVKHIFLHLPPQSYL